LLVNDGVAVLIVQKPNKDISPGGPSFSFRVTDGDFAVTEIGSANTLDFIPCIFVDDLRIIILDRFAFLCSFTTPGTFTGLIFADNASIRCSKRTLRHRWSARA
jgi:hypothetical protein